MESDSDGEEEVFSGMKLPPLIDQLKRILAEYPDGGQILKELIQNAEDAGATEVKLLYDQRCINQNIDGGKEYRKFFQGPALCVYNNALFQEVDWQGIQMIDMSVKESEPLKVGRFGLGFKSVFHLTDYPCVLSGDRLLLMNPHKERDKVNAMMLLNRLEKYKRMDVEAFFTALEGSFGINRQSIKTGPFHGTLFWFPLRNTASKLSSNLYNEEKIMTLLESIRLEKQSLIIFLKSLTSIRIEIRKPKDQHVTHLVVEVENSQGVSKKRRDFREGIDNLAKHGGQAIECALEMKINTSVLSGDGETLENSSVTWLVLNYFMGNNASSEFQRLIEDKELGLSPYVSVGAPISKEAIEGHVFCFLPLPREDTSLTGLHVHINGFFALNQSRHHLKWSTEEQSGHEITDKNVLWNKYLISEVLPLAYKSWFQNALQLTINYPNDVNLIETIHRAIPVSNQVQGKWQELLSSLFRHLKEMKILYSRNHRAWVSADEALFPDVTCHISDDCHQTVVKALTQMYKNYVEVPHGLVETLNEYFKLDKNRTLLTPFIFSQMLLNDRNQNYKSMSVDDKLKLVEYILQGNEVNYLRGLELLPLASGRWIDFRSNTSEKVYLCDSEEVQIYQGMEDKILLQKSKFPGKVFSHFEKISNSGSYQLKRICKQSELEAMLQGALTTLIPNDSRRDKKNTREKHVLTWLQNVWTYLLRRSKTSVCEAVPLIPLLTNGTWSNPEVDLVKATNKLIMREYNNHRLQDDVVNCLRALSFDVLPSLPDWLPFKDIKSYVYLPKLESVVEILSNIWQHCGYQEQQQIVTKFNNTHKSCRKKFMQYICDAVNYQTPCISLLKQLQMFESFQSSTSNSNVLSINGNRQFVVIDTFPVSLPRTFIDGSGNTRKILEHLGAEQVNHFDLVIMILNYILEGRYNQNDIVAFMNYLVENFSSIKYSCSEGNKRMFVQKASQISFLRTRNGLKNPSELFNPKDKLLLDLFKGECVFPEVTLTDKEVNVLLELGLKNLTQLSTTDIVTSARLLDSWSRSRINPEDAIVKSTAMIEILSTNAKVLDKYTEGRPLKYLLGDLEIIRPKQRKPDSYPNWLPWYSQTNLLCKPSDVKHIKIASLVGSVMPVVDCISDQLSATFLWESDIPTHTLTKQLNIIQKQFQAKYRPFLLDYLQQLYKWLNLHMRDRTVWESMTFIWVDKQFCKPNEVITQKQENDLTLEPFFFNIPAEFEDSCELFEMLGCYRYQSIDVLLETLSKIQMNDNKSDVSLTIIILKRLADRVDEIAMETRKNILIPIHNENNGGLEFKRLEDCTYTDDPDDYLSEDEDDDASQEDMIFFVHRSVPADVAARLGIRSLLRRHLINTEAINVEEWGQEEPLTTRLKTLIEEGYVDGLSVPKELLQNADDAGATCLKLLYDERENLDAMGSLLNQGMKTCHGPSLWVYNDSKFSDEDFLNITKLNAATKRQNMHTIGKFGLGFCSVYNLTDVPSIVSGSNIVIFDPHKSHLKDSLSGNSPGLKIDFSKKGNIKLLKRNRDQFQPYSGVFGCDLTTKTPYFHGTLFRLPLRSSDESKVSKIKAEPYTPRDVSELLTLFVDNAINLLLFMQNIQTVEVFHLKSSAKTTTEQQLLFRVCRNSPKGSEHKTILSQFSNNHSSISEIQKLDILFEVFEPIQNMKPKLAINPAKSHSSWVLSWATGTRRIKTLLKDPHFNSYLPLAAVAVPLHDDNSGPKQLFEIGLGSFKTGRLYCFLPIPYDIQLPWHLHGCFEVTSDRRQLKVVTEQDKPTNRESWNECLLEDAGVNAFIQLMEHLTTADMSNYVYHKLWPIQTSDTIKPFVKSFYKHIVIEDINIFEAASGWFSFKDIIILDPAIREDKTIGEISYIMLQSFTPRPNHAIVDIPQHIIKALKLSNDKESIKVINSKIVQPEEMLQVFFLNISDSFWDTKFEKRNDIVKYALKSKNKIVHNMLKTTRCIPCVNTFDLKRPEELLHPESSVSTMFCDADNMFPACDFRDKSTLEALVQHGMINQTLPIEMLLQRIQSIETLAKQCTACARIRIRSIIQYLVNALDKYKEGSFYAIKDTFWLPVLQKSSDWIFTWFADEQNDMVICKGNSCPAHIKKGGTLVLGKACKLYGGQDIDYIASVSNVVDDKQLGNVSVLDWQKIGLVNIDSQQGFEDVVHQLVKLAEEYDPSSMYTSYSRIYRKAVQALDNGIKKNEERLYMLKQLSDKHFIVIDHQKLVPPCQVAFEVKQPCYPFLCKLPDQDQQFSEFYKGIGVAESFSFDDIINALIKTGRVNNYLNKSDIDQVIRILHNLVDFLEQHDKTYMAYEKYHDVIVGPDYSGCLHPTHQLALDDKTFSSSVQMKLIHDAFPRSLAKKLGVKSKMLKCIEYISCGIPWGQEEKLVTRIQGILKDYPCDDSILKELLQNADDANAKELHFIMDFRNHPTDTIIGNGNLQKPALCVYNDGYFTDNDLLGIKNLGIGSKKKDASKTGQFGIGFNAVYHLTDTPSFLTKGPGLEDGGVLCILDPLCCDIPVDQSNPGLRFSQKQVHNNYPNSLSGYLEKNGFFHSGQGTMFRFPLRREQSSLSINTVTDSELRSLLKTFSESILDSLLFVKNIEKIQISSITDENLVLEYSLIVKIDTEERCKREQFFKEVNTTCKKNKENAWENLQEGQIYVNYEVEVKDSKGAETKWIIFQTFGCPKGAFISKSIIEAFKDENLGHLPLGGVAIPYPDFYKPTEETKLVKNYVGEKIKSFSAYAQSFGSIFNPKSYFKSAPECKQGRLFAFLPLPVKTGFKIHINANFSLDHSRRDIWKEGYRDEWNTFLGENTIVVSWINALKYLHKYFTPSSLSGNKVCSQKQVWEMIKEYHALFPVLDNLHHDFSKVLVEKFYDTVYREDVALFPTVTVDNPETIIVKWVSLKEGSKMFGAVFKEKTTEENEELYLVLKQIGMTLVETPIQIYTTLKELGHQDIPLLHPDFVITFLHSFESEESGSCSIGNIDTSIENTHFMNVKNLKSLVQYISKAPEFTSKVENLPILLAADEKIHTFRKCSNIYHSSFYNLLPSSKSVFLHRDFLCLLNDGIFFTEGFLQKLNIESFKSLLQHEAIEEYRKSRPVDWDKTDTDKLITSKWIYEFFSFIERNSSNIDPPYFAQNIAKFDDLSVLPAVFHTADGVNKYQLVPISMSYTLFYDNCLKHDVAKVIKKLHVPHLDESLFPDSASGIKLRKQVISILPNSKTPIELLKCLHYHLQITGASNLTVMDSRFLLIYFSNNVDELKECMESQLYLKKLPLHLTFDNNLVSIQDKETIILSSQIPMDGIHDWATGVDKIVLKENKDLLQLYKFLSLSGSDIVQFYADILIPSVTFLPQEHWYAHFYRIREYIYRNDEDSKKILRQLKELRLFKVGTKMKKASDLFWPDNDVFKVLVDDDQFPPKEYRKKEWKQFCESLNMHFEVTDELLITFAYSIEVRGQNHINKKVKDQSETLLSHFCWSQWKDETLYALKSIKFICPYEIDDDLRNIYVQPDACKRLIAFSQSVSADYRLVCWSSMNMISYLPYWKHTIEKLNIYKKPPLDKVISHCQNIGISIQNKLIQGIHVPHIEALMEKNYNFLEMEMKNQKDVVANRLENFPFVYIPDHNVLIKCKAVIIEIDSGSEIPPYLYKAPSYYGKYFKLFQNIGAKQKFQLSHCVFVLAELKSKVKENEMLPDELHVVKEVLVQMPRILENSDELTFHGTLYLPNRDKILKDAKSLTVSDRISYERKLHGKIAIEFCLDFVHLEIKDLDQAKILKKLPANVRPAILSDVCKEMFDESSFEIVEHSLIASKIEDFLHSNYFIEGFIRFYKHSKNQYNEDYDHQTIDQFITENIRNIQIISVSNLKSLLSYKGVVIDGSQMKRCYYAKVGKNVKTLYISENELDGGLSGVVLINDGIKKLLQSFTNAKFYIDWSVLASLTLKIDNPWAINGELDRLEIDDYKLPGNLRLSVFPKPGQYVQDCFLPFLEAAIVPFKKEEFQFVALELEDSVLRNDANKDNEQSDYIYVRIIAEIKRSLNTSDLNRMYRVNTGNMLSDLEEVPIYRLYRFVRRQCDISDIEEFDAEPIGSVAFDETCQRIRDMLQEAWSFPETERKRIIRRLILKWHPDKNKGNEEYCKDIFNYIKSVILLLEKGEQVSSIIDRNSFRSAPNMSESMYDNLVRNVTRQATSHARAYYDNEDDYNRSRHTGPYSHDSSSRPTPRPDISEARRWMRQAKTDYRAANAFSTTTRDTEGHNWICYTCHQACEKALRAAHYSKNANEVPGNTHYLNILASPLRMELSHQVLEIERRLHDHNRMRYPNAVSRPNIPSDLYSEDDANFALEKTKELIDTVENEFNLH